MGLKELDFRAWGEDQRFVSVPLRGMGLKVQQHPPDDKTYWSEFPSPCGEWV